MFVISWRNPDARHADWGFDAYVQAVIEALDAVDRICGTDRAALFGVLLRGHHRHASPPPTSPAPGEQDRLAALGLGVTVLDYTDAGLPGALVDRGWPPPRRRCRGAAATSTGGRWPRCSPGCARATWSGTTG